MIGVLVFPDFQLLDAAGPISVFEIAGRTQGAPAVDPRGRGEARRSSQFIRRCDDGAEFCRGARHGHPDRGRRRGGAHRGGVPADAGFRPRGGAARLPHRQRLLRRLCAGGSRRARRPPRHHPLGPHPAFRRRLSEDQARSRPHLRPRRQRLDVRPGSAPASTWRWRWLRRISATRWRAPPRASSWSITAAPAARPQFSSLLELKAPTGRFAALLSWAREHLDQPLTVEQLAEQAGMSSRHFARAFAAETGATPSKAVERLRIEVARQRVQSSTEAIELVARATGFRDPERMRRAFIRSFGQPPQALRRAARAG